MNQWFFHVDGSQQGPFDGAAAAPFAQAPPPAHCWRPGFTEWVAGQPRGLVEWGGGGDRPHVRRRRAARG